MVEIPTSFAKTVVYAMKESLNLDLVLVLLSPLLMSNQLHQRMYPLWIMLLMEVAVTTTFPVTQEATMLPQERVALWTIRFKNRSVETVWSRGCFLPDSFRTWEETFIHGRNGTIPLSLETPIEQARVSTNWQDGWPLLLNTQEENNTVDKQALESTLQASTKAKLCCRKMKRA